MTQEEGYTIKTRREIVEYIQKLGLKLSDFNRQLGGNYALVYKLSSGEVALLPNGSLSSDYPSFLFKDEKEFTKMIKNDSFPLEERYLSVLEIEYNRMKDIENNKYYYYNSLASVLNISFNTGLNEELLKQVYARIAQYRTDDKKKYEKLVLSYSIIYMDFLKKEYGGSWEIKKKYGVYNPYIMLEIKTSEKRYNVYEKLLIALEGKQPVDFYFLKKTIQTF